jgi:polyisoprenoid-binding protein YceI
MQLDSDHAKVIAAVGGAEGRFAIVAGALQYDPAKPDNSTLLLSLDASSIQDVAARGVFDAARYPEMRIVSTAAIKSGVLTAAVTIRDITRSMIFRVSFKTVSPDVIALHAEATIKSADFHLVGKGGDIPFVIDAPFDKVEPTRPLP